MTARRYPLTRAATPDTIRGDDWRDRAACIGHEGVFDVAADHPNDGHALAAALAICLDCPVADLCLRAHVREEFGVVGGTTPAERKKLRRTPKPPDGPVHRCGYCARAYTSSKSLAMHHAKKHALETGLCAKGHDYTPPGRCEKCKYDVEARYRDRQREAS